MIRFNTQHDSFMFAVGFGLVVLSSSATAKQTDNHHPKSATIVKSTTAKSTPSTKNLVVKGRETTKGLKTTAVIAAKPVKKSGASGQVHKVSYAPASVKTQFISSGVASYYGPGFHGRRTANGETFNMHAMTAAHRTLPFGTKLRVTNLNNGQSTIVRVNDRGPYVGGRIIDLSVAAAKSIGSTHSGVAHVNIEVIRD
jgi:rare lipoprotein A (peptidoglycan hydrolase)